MDKINVIEPVPEDADKRTCIRVFSKNDVLIERSYGPTIEEKQEAHDNHECGAFCTICYDEAMRSEGRKWIRSYHDKKTTSVST